MTKNNAGKSSKSYTAKRLEKVKNLNHITRKNTRGRRRSITAMRLMGAELKAMNDF